MVALGEMRKVRRERIEKGSREGIEKETKRQFEEKEGLRDPPLSGLELKHQNLFLQTTRKHY